jgi:Cu-Zn family superoxide dismutase
MRSLVLAVAVGFALAGCASMQGMGGGAAADLKDKDGKSVGMATFTEVSGGIRIVVEAKDLPPGPHAVHIHAVGKCDAPDFMTSGGHFNPGNKQHGSLSAQGPHAGDLPNMSVDGLGAGRLETVTDRITIAAGPNSVFDADGSALVIHAGSDDYRTDPMGNSGGRIACGVLVKK